MIDYIIPVVLIGAVIIMTVAGQQIEWMPPAAALPYISAFHAAAEGYQVPMPLLIRVAEQESHFDPLAYNDSGASGIMQLIPKFYPDVDPWDPMQAILAGAKSLAKYHRQFGTWPLALAAYNWGPGNLSSAIAAGDGPDTWPTETQNYVTDIIGDVGAQIA